jgi:diacylglycerol kinase (ATP)
VKASVILNPKAGAAKQIIGLAAKIRRHGFKEIHITRKAGDAEKFARVAARRGRDLIIAAGGDGTLNEIVNGIARSASHVRLGMIPLGTGNDFARSLKLPNDFESALEILKEDRTRYVDLVRVTSRRIRYFVNVSAGGFSGLVNEKLTAQIKQTWGPLAYLRSAAAALAGLRAYKTAITLDQKKTSQRSLFNVVIANGRYIAGGIPIAPKAKLDDGLLDVVLVPRVSKTKLTFLAGRMLLGRHLASGSVIFRRAAKVAVQSRPGMWFNVDGELVGNAPVTFEIVPRGIHFVAGANTGNRELSSSISARRRQNSARAALPQR